MHRLLSIVSALGVLYAGSLAAQGVPIAWQPLSQAPASALYASPAVGPLSARPFSAEPVDTVVRDIKPTHWKEGGIIGGLALGAAGGLLGSAFCGDSDVGGSCTGLIVGGALGGAVLGFLTGALVGGQFPKH
jgi:hypothetical protein